MYALAVRNCKNLHRASARSPKGAPVNLNVEPGQIGCLAVAFVLSTVVGLERQLRHKSAGMRTHTLVGLGAALFMVVSKHAFDDVLAADLVRLDPSRVAAQIVSGIGFIGAGVVFTRRNRVRGLTTAASIWLTAAIGTAAGGGLVVPAAFVTLVYLVVVVAYPWLSRLLSLGGDAHYTVRVDYLDGHGALRDIIAVCTDGGYVVEGFTTSRPAGEGAGVGDLVGVELELVGADDVSGLVGALARTPGVVGTSSDDAE